MCNSALERQTSEISNEVSALVVSGRATRNEKSTLLNGKDEKNFKKKFKKNIEGIVESYWKISTASPIKKKATISGSACSDG